MDAVLSATIKAYDEFNQQFRRFQDELKKTDRTQKDTAQGTEQMNRSFSGFMQTIGNLGALYAFQRALREVMATGREFELAIKQAQAVTGDFSSTLRDLAMVSSGSKLDVYTPSQLAQAYRELGAAGATTNDIIGSTPDILEFGTAAIIDMNQSAEAVLATAKSFNIALTDSGTIVDAYTQAMNQGALAGEDFKWIMGSVGAVAKMAGQDFREILSVGSAMRDSGIQAQDAGTSIKGALLQLINPTKEAQAVMKDLGINIYDSSGKMKQWSEITAEFEKGLAPLNEQSRNLVLATVLGSDGIRAMATSINKGSGYLREFTDGLKNSEGATNKMASAMADTFDGAIRRTNASLERAKVLLFEDFASASMGFLQTITTLLVGFNNVDEGTRKLIELFVGSMGLVAALGLIASTIRLAVIPALRAMGIAASASLGPWGLLIAGVTTITGLLLGVRVAEAGVRAEMENHNKTIVAAGESYLRLDDKLNQAKKDTAEYKALQGQTNSALQELARQMPEVISQWDAEGNAIAVNNDLLREKIRLTREAAQESARAGLTDALKKETELQDELKRLTQSSDNPADYDVWNAIGMAGGNQEAIDKIREAQSELAKIRSEISKYSAVVASDSGGDWKDTFTRSLPTPQRDTGNQNYTPTTGGGSTKNPAAEAARKYIEAITDALHPYQSAAEAAANAVGGLGAKEQYLAQMMEAGLGDTNTAIELNKTRAAQLTQLTAQQDALKKQADAERLALASLQEQYEAANDPETARDLRDEMDNLTRSVAQLGQQWWQVEQQKLDLTLKLKQEEKKRYDDAYQQAMDLMQHQVNMARMSTEQQIEYLIKLRNAHEWSASQMQGIDENLYRLRRQQMQAYLSELEEEYQDRLDAIDDRTEATAQAIQDQIDALKRQGDLSGREEAERTHNQRLLSLQEQRRYHELRTGVEHQRALADLDQQIAEENHDWELQQQEWALQDQEDALQEQLDQVREEGEEEREELERHYRRAREIAENGIFDIIASLAATNPEWMETGKELIDSLIEGLESGDFSEVLRRIRSIGSEIPDVDDPDMPGGGGGSGGGSGGGDDDDETETRKLIAAITSSWYEEQNGRTYMPSRDLASFLGKSVEWDARTNKVKIGSKWFTPWKIEPGPNGRSWVGIREVAEALGYDVDFDDGTVKIYEAAQGMYAPARPGGYLVNLAEAGEDEIVAPLSKFQPMINAAVEYAFTANLKGAIGAITVPVAGGYEGKGGGGGGIVININAPLLAPENIHLYNHLDIEDIGDGLRKEIMALATAKG